MANNETPAHPNGLGATQRPDKWWIPPLSTIIGLTLGFGYLTWAAFFGSPADGGVLNTGFNGNLLSPVYSPPLHHWFPFLAPGGPLLPKWFSPALLILWAPGGFRMTCYYYRKAYYRAGFASPPGCGVMGVPRDEYKGETVFPFLLQNVHRYFMMLAVLFVVVFLPMDVWQSMWFDAPGGGKEFGISLGTLILAGNTIFLGFYTFGCHSLRHFIGGKVDCFSCDKSVGLFRFKLWHRITMFNEKHMLWAWTSLTTVTMTDLFVRLVNWGIIENVRFF